MVLKYILVSCLIQSVLGASLIIEDDGAHKRVTRCVTCGDYPPPFGPPGPPPPPIFHHREWAGSSRFYGPDGSQYGQGAFSGAHVSSSQAPSSGQHAFSGAIASSSQGQTGLSQAQAISLASANGDGQQTQNLGDQGLQQNQGFRAGNYGGSSNQARSLSSTELQNGGYLRNANYGSNYVGGGQQAQLLDNVRDHQTGTYGVSGNSQATAVSSSNSQASGLGFNNQQGRLASSGHNNDVGLQQSSALANSKFESYNHNGLKQNVGGSDFNNHQNGYSNIRGSESLASSSASSGTGLQQQSLLHNSQSEHYNPNIQNHPNLHSGDYSQRNIILDSKNLGSHSLAQSSSAASNGNSGYGSLYIQQKKSHTGQEGSNHLSSQSASIGSDGLQVEQFNHYNNAQQTESLDLNHNGKLSLTNAANSGSAAASYGSSGSYIANANTQQNLATNTKLDKRGDLAGTLAQGQSALDLANQQSSLLQQQSSTGCSKCDSKGKNLAVSNSQSTNGDALSISVSG